MAQINGFKATNKDMTCRDFQFELGKTFKHNGKIIPCASGFHFCQNIESIQEYYNADCRIFEVVSGENSIEHYDKTVTDQITFLKEIDYSQYIDHESYWVRAVVAHQGIGLNQLVDDDYYLVRLEVAKHGYGLEKLVNDSEWSVRAAVAEQGYGLDKLIDDDDCDVRGVVAEQGYGLDKLVNDPSWYVRREVAKQGYGIDKLIDDDDCDVRHEASKHLSEGN